MSASVAERIAKVRDPIAEMIARGVPVPEKMVELLRVTIRRACAMRIVDLVSEGFSVREAVSITYRESGMNVSEVAIKETAENFEKNWDAFVRSAPVEIVSDEEFAEILAKAQKGTVLA